MSRTRFRVNLTLYSCLNVKELRARNRREIVGSSPVAVTYTNQNVKRTTNDSGELPISEAKAAAASWAQK